MAKAIYCLKISLFPSQSSLTTKQKKAVTSVANFVSTVYVMYWHEACLSTYAPKNDLDLIQKLQKYPDKGIADKALESIGRHLWYLSEELVSLAFFDDRISAEEKEVMPGNLSKPAGKMLKRLDSKSFFR
jgi:hypothetical protein